MDGGVRLVDTPEASGKKRILIADDDKDLVYALSLRLGAAGFDVICANDGEEALKKAVREKPDLIIVDIRMPAGGGFSVIDHLKHGLTTRDIPIIVLTAFDEEDLKERARVLGAKFCFRKPFNDREFMDAIKSAITRAP